MENVFDNIESMYDGENGLESIIQQQEIEGFIRTKAWAGCSDEQLTIVYEQVFMIIIYLKMTDLSFESMDENNFVDMVAWLKRNLPIFDLEEKKLAEILDCWQDLFDFLAKKRRLSCAKAPQYAKAMLLPKGKLALIDKEGNFLPEAGALADYATPNPDKGILLEAGDAYDLLRNCLRAFFVKDCYKKDYLRALKLFYLGLAKYNKDLDPTTIIYSDDFWQYFLFDYRMIDIDLAPIQYFFEKDFAKSEFHWNAFDCSLLEKLQGTRLKLFTLECPREDGYYRCYDLLTKKHFSAIIPVEERLLEQDQLRLGHVYGKDCCLMNNTSKIHLPKVFTKKMLEQLESWREWVSLSWGRRPSWEEFIERYPLLLQHVILLYSTQLMPCGFNYQTRVQNYRPTEIPSWISEKFTETLSILQESLEIPVYDMKLIENMAADFFNAYTIKTEDEDLWAIVLVEGFMRLNKLRDDNATEEAEEDEELDLEGKLKILSEVLQLEEFDPRYVNEYGLLVMTSIK